MANDALVKLLNSYGYQPVFLPRTNVAPPELYSHIEEDDRLIRYGPLKYFLPEVDTLAPTRGAVPDLYHKETKGKNLKGSVSFLQDALRALGITSVPKLDLTFAGKAELVFSFSEVSYIAIDPIQLYTTLNKFMTAQSIPEKYISEGRLHIVYEYLYSKRLLMSRSDHKAFDTDVSGKIGDFIDVGTSAHVETDGATVVSFAPLGTDLPAFAYKAGRLSLENGHWVFEPGVVGAMREIDKAALPQYLPKPAVVLTVQDSAAPELREAVMRGLPTSSPTTGQNRAEGVAAKAITRIQQTPQMRFAELATPEMRGLLNGPTVPEQWIKDLQPYVINLEQGRFSESGQFQSSRQQVDEIIAGLDAYAKEKGDSAKVVLYAHGGLVDEGSALTSAHAYYRWWVDKDVYPIYFVWETGVLETIKQFLTGAMFRMRTAEAMRDVWDWTTDPLLECAARTAQIGKLWAGMKHGAMRAGENGSDALYFISKLKSLCAKYSKLQIHAVGHSAGSIFHGYLLPAAVSAGLPPIESLHLLAPAIRNDLFRGAILPEWKRGNIKAVDMFTMFERLEKDDNCDGVYRKSLLYLVYHALEDEEDTPILGLEETLRRDHVLASAFGLTSGALPGGQVVFSETHINSHTASTSHSHGGFDDDPATMESVLRRICGCADGQPIKPFPAAKAAAAGGMLIEVP